MFSSLTKLQSKLHVEMLVFHTHIILKKKQKKKIQSNNKASIQENGRKLLKREISRFMECL